MVIAATEKGISNIMAKMDISLLQSYKARMAGMVMWYGIRLGVWMILEKVMSKVTIKMDMKFLLIYDVRLG